MRPPSPQARLDRAALDLLGTCRRDLSTLRSVVAELLAGCHADAKPCTPEDGDHSWRLLQKLAPVIETGHCPTCAQPLPNSTRRPRKFCTARCRSSDQAMRRRGLLLGGPTRRCRCHARASTAQRELPGCEPHTRLHRSTR